MHVALSASDSSKSEDAQRKNSHIRSNGQRHTSQRMQPQPAPTHAPDPARQKSDRPVHAAIITLASSAAGFRAPQRSCSTGTGSRRCLQHAKRSSTLRDTRIKEPPSSTAWLATVARSCNDRTSGNDGSDLRHKSRNRPGWFSFINNRKRCCIWSRVADV
jgi:hypothetical protein